MWGASQMPRGTRSLYLCRGWHGIITRLASLPRMGQCYYSTYKADCQDLCEKLPFPFPSDRGLHVRIAITWRRAPTKHKFCATRRAKFSFCIIAFTSKKTALFEHSVIIIPYPALPVKVTTYSGQYLHTERRRFHRFALYRTPLCPFPLPARRSGAPHPPL